MQARSIGDCVYDFILKGLKSYSFILLYCRDSYVLARPASDTPNSRASKEGGGEGSFKIKGVTPEDEDVQLGILVFALMVVAIAVSLALMIMSCVLKARTRQRDEMQERVEELEMILQVKVNGSTNDKDNEDLMKRLHTEKSKSGSMFTLPKEPLPVALRSASDRVDRKPIRERPTLPSQSAPTIALPRTYTRNQVPPMPPSQAPPSDTAPSYDHSLGEAFTSSPESFATPVTEPIPSSVQPEPNIHAPQSNKGATVNAGQCPPTAAWLTDVLVDSPQPESASIAKREEPQ